MADELVQGDARRSDAPTTVVQYSSGLSLPAVVIQALCSRTSSRNSMRQRSRRSLRRARSCRRRAENRERCRNRKLRPGWAQSLVAELPRRLPSRASLSRLAADFAHGVDSAALTFKVGSRENFAQQAGAEEDDAGDEEQRRRQATSGPCSTMTSPPVIIFFTAMPNNASAPEPALIRPHLPKKCIGRVKYFSEEPDGEDVEHHAERAADAVVRSAVEARGRLRIGDLARCGLHKARRGRG